MSPLTSPLSRLARYIRRDLPGDLNRFAFFVVGPVERRQARRRQDRLVGTFVGVTGSVGKSTACYVAAELLKTAGTVQLGLYNNTGRRSLRTLRKLTRPVDVVVQEMSGHEHGAIESATRTIRIDAAIITTVGLDHLSEFRTKEAVAAEKSKLVEAVAAGGTVCLNADDPLVRAMSAKTTARVVLYGRGAEAEVRAENVSAVWPARLNFDLVVGTMRRHVETRFVGTTLITSVLAALSLVHALGHDLDAALLRLAELEPLSNRQGVLRGSDGHDYLLDTYKASHWSTEKLVEDLVNWGASPRVFVLGQMSDTGNESGRKYRRLLREAAQHCDFVIGVGAAASAAEKLARNEKLSNVVPARDIAEVRQLIAQQRPSLVILKSTPQVPLTEVLPASSEPPRSGDINRSINH